MIKYKIIIYWSEEDQTYIVEVPELAGCKADGATYQEAVINVEQIISEWIERANELGRTIPKPKACMQKIERQEKTNINRFNQSLIESFIPPVNYLSKVLSEKILPAFDDKEEGVSHYDSCDDELDDYCRMEELRQDARQSMINLHVVALRHSYEQQISLLVMQSLGNNYTREANYKCDEKILIEVDELNIENFRSWEKLKELEYVCNVVKHAEGYSAKKLEKVRPDLFKTPFQDDGYSAGKRLPVRQPLNGDGVFLQEQDIQEYALVIKNFWNEFIEKLDSRSSHE